MSLAAVASTWGELRAQLQGNARLRWGAWLIIGIVWVYALLVAGDAVRAERERATALAEQVDRLRPPKGADPWPQRADDARQQLAALQSMLWQGGVDGGSGDIGLAEAGFQDWVRATAAKSGVRLREMSLARSTVAAGAAASPASGAQGIRLRLNLEWSHVELMAFLAEIGRHERVIVVERLLLRPASPLGSAEIDLRVLAANRAAPALSASPSGGAR